MPSIHKYFMLTSILSTLDRLSKFSVFYMLETTEMYKCLFSKVVFRLKLQYEFQKIYDNNYNIRYTLGFHQFIL